MTNYPPMIKIRTMESRLTSLIASDHLTNAFGKLAHRIAHRLAMGEKPQDVVNEMLKTHTVIDVKLAFAAAKILANIDG